jgi:limonene-1,2-epoxide hydrolase
MMSPSETVDAFQTAWDAGDIERICDLVSDDVFYHNIPRSPIQGRDAFRSYIQSYIDRFGRILSVNWEVKNRAVNGNVVFIERVSRLTFENGRRTVCPIAGVFEVTDGKISAWRDYFDRATFDE